MKFRGCNYPSVVFFHRTFVFQKMEVREGVSSKIEEERQLHSGADFDAGEVLLVNPAKDASRSYKRKKEKLELATPLGKNEICKRNFDLETQDWGEDVADQQKLEASTSDATLHTTSKKVESTLEELRENSVVRFEVGAKVQSAPVTKGVRFPSELRRQVLEDLQRLPQVEVCKR